LRTMNAFSARPRPAGVHHRDRDRIGAQRQAAYRGIRQAAGDIQHHPAG